MSDIIRTEHTVLAKVVSPSTDRAEVLVGHIAICNDHDFSDPGLRYSQFGRYTKGQLVALRIKLSGSRRLLQWEATFSGTPEDFVNHWRKELINEAREYNKRHEISDDWDPYNGWVDGTAPNSESAAAWYDDVWSAGDEEDPIEDQIREAEDVDEWETKIYIRDKDRELMDAVRNLAKKRHKAVMMIGPSGYGKTSIPEQMAEEWGMNHHEQDCVMVRDPEEFFGLRGARDGSTMNEDGTPIFMESEFTKAVQQGNTVIVLDELNRVDPYISNILFPLLDHRGKASFLGYDIEVGPNTIFFATINMGYQFTGTFTLDAALSNRFGAKILVGALPKDIERKILMARGDVPYDTANVIVELMDRLRNLNEKGELSVDASTRVSINVAELVGAGLDLRQAIVYTIVNGIDEEESKLVVDELGYVLS